MRALWGRHMDNEIAMFWEGAFSAEPGTYRLAIGSEIDAWFGRIAAP